MEKKCRVCGQAFFAEPLLRYQNMPMVAQHLPDAETIKEDRGIDLEVCQCLGCGLVQLSSDPVSYYKEVIRAVAVSAEMKDFRVKQFARFVQQYSLKGKKVIEIGCGRGEYLSIIERPGIKAYGLEYGKDSVKRCVERGLSVSRGFVESEDYTIDNAPFDVFFILSFFEHLPDPNSVLRGIHNNLVDDAVGIVEVPNFDMILKKNLFSEFMRDHLFYFSKETLTTTLRLNGFEIIECNEVWHDYIISATVRKRKKIDLASFYGHQAKLKGEINEFVSHFDNNVAIWGAGHQAFAVISMLKLDGKIKYVVDSAVFKQGKFTPATHLPIVAPNTIDANPVEAILVMAGSYSDEVVKIIKRKYGKMIDVAVLRSFGLEIV